MNNNENLQIAVNALRDCMDAIDDIRKKYSGMNCNEVAQKVLMDSCSLSQTEAAEIVDGIENGIQQYHTIHDAVSVNRETAIKDSLSKATESMNENERNHYYASLLTALQLASTTEVTAEVIDATMNENQAKAEDELINDIVVALGTLPLEGISESVKQLDTEAVKIVAEVISKNTDEYRFYAALQLYMAQRKGTFKCPEGGTTLTPQFIGSLAAGAVDVILATSDLKAGKIDLCKWQQIVKGILGVLVFCACLMVSVIAVILLTIPVISVFVDVFGTGVFAMITLFAVMVPTMQYLSEVILDVTSDIMNKLGAIYDKYIGPLTSWTHNVLEKIKIWMTEKATHVIPESVKPVPVTQQPVIGNEENPTPALA